MKLKRQMFTPVFGAIVLMAGSVIQAQAQSVNWAGYTWNESSSAMGDGEIDSNPSNVSVDSNGYLHLAISESGSTWTGSEIGTSNNFGFGSFYWVFSGPINAMQQQIVLAGFLYGPQNGIGTDGQNEIDVEFSNWNVADVADNGDFAIYPTTGVTTGQSASDLWNWTSGTVATCRVDWTSTSVTESIWSGVVATNAPTSTAAVTWTYNGTTQSIPQPACPWLFNVWAYGAKPSQTLNIAIENFEYTAAGTATVPAAPTNLIGTPGQYQTALTWTGSSGATSYNVYRGYSSGTESSTPVATGIILPGYTDTGLTAGNTYYYKVAAVNSAGTSGKSNEVSSVPTGVTVPAAPTSLSGTAGAYKSILSWTASSGATSYNVYRGYSSGTESSTPVATGITSTGYTDTGLTAGNTYYYVVAAVNSAGTSSKSNEVHVVPNN